MTTPNIEAIIFDLGRVLVAIDNTVLVEKLFRGFDKNDPDFTQRTMRNEHMVKFNSGRMSPEDFHRSMQSTFGIEVDFDGFVSLWQSIFYTMDKMEELVMGLKGRVKLGLLSDTDPIHWNHIITTWPWIGTIEKPTLSYEVGVMKPDRQIYLAAAKNVNTPPENCLFVDDLEANVKGAREVGMTAVQFESVRHLQELLQRKNIL